MWERYHRFLWLTRSAVKILVALAMKTPGAMEMS
jgi:hypothetical protein